jgi:hypothetical protein
LVSSPRCPGSTVLGIYQRNSRLMSLLRRDQH